jgi:hypothetical protein
VTVLFNLLFYYFHMKYYIKKILTCTEMNNAIKTFHIGIRNLTMKASIKDTIINGV